MEIASESIADNPVENVDAVVDAPETASEAEEELTEPDVDAEPLTPDPAELDAAGTTIRSEVDGVEAEIKVDSPETPQAADPKSSTNGHSNGKRAQLELVRPSWEELGRTHAKNLAYYAQCEAENEETKAELKIAKLRVEASAHQLLMRSQTSDQPELPLREATEPATKLEPTAEDRYVISGTDGTVVAGGKYLRVPHETKPDACACGAAMDAEGTSHDRVHGAFIGQPEGGDYAMIPNENVPSTCVCGVAIDLGDVEEHQRQHAAFTKVLFGDVAPQAAVPDVPAEAEIAVSP